MPSSKLLLRYRREFEAIVLTNVTLWYSGNPASFYIGEGNMDAAVELQYVRDCFMKDLDEFFVGKKWSDVTPEALENIRSHTQYLLETLFDGPIRVEGVIEPNNVRMRCYIPMPDSAIMPKSLVKEILVEFETTFNVITSRFEY